MTHSIIGKHPLTNIRLFSTLVAYVTTQFQTTFLSLVFFTAAFLE